MRVQLMAAGIFAASLSGLAAHPAYAGGDVAAGKAVFARCRACHTADQPQNRVGPYLMGVVGRTAGTAEGYAYSAAMKAEGAKGVVWSEQALTQYLASPRAVVPGTRMTFAGLKSNTDIENIIAYLRSMNAPTQ